MKDLKRLLPWLKGSRTTAFVALIFSSLATICKLAIPFLAGLLIDYYDFVCKYDDFLDHEIEEGGTNLSGGQKQRLLIARALLRPADLLILDDSMSALDYLSDQKVRANIAKIKNLTKIIVSQRASSLIDCDKILVFDKGQIIASGKHDELLKSCEIYREIFEIQKGGVK